MKITSVTKSVFMALLIAAAIPHSAYAGCDSESITRVSGNGEIIFLSDGSVWKTYDTGTSSSWSSGEDVQVCGDKLINTDDNGEEVDAERIK